MKKELKEFLIENCTESDFYANEYKKSLKELSLIKNTNSNCGGCEGYEPHAWYFIDLNTMQIITEWNENSKENLEILYGNDHIKSIFDNWQQVPYSPGLYDIHKCVSESGYVFGNKHNFNPTYLNKYFKHNKNTCVFVIYKVWGNHGSYGGYELEYELYYNDEKIL